eukprot:7135396-Prymnesium_polylepis.1
MRVVTCAPKQVAKASPYASESRGRLRFAIAFLRGTARAAAPRDRGREVDPTGGDGGRMPAAART